MPTNTTFNLLISAASEFITDTLVLTDVNQLLQTDSVWIHFVCPPESTDAFKNVKYPQSAEATSLPVVLKNSNVSKIKKLKGDFETFHQSSDIVP